MELVRDLLDKQVVDRQQTKIGKVDGIVMELRPGKPPRITSIEIGATTLARRIGPRVGHLVSRVANRLSREGSRTPYRISWDKARDIGVDIECDIDVRDTTIFDWQNWLRDKVICRIPGA
jgi:sporulation protein YlmC with PRC-barrel domain